jgi:hypothetical protein
MQAPLFPSLDGPTSVPCGQCGAAASEPCHSAHGQVYPTYIHSAREKLAALKLPANPDRSWSLTDVDPALLGSVAFLADCQAVAWILRKYGNLHEA